MIAYANRKFRVGASRKIFACLALGLWLFSFSCVMPRAALAEYVSRPPDYYLVGVDKIIVWANEPYDTETNWYENRHGHQNKIRNVDFVALNRSIADQVRAALSEKLKRKIQVETIFDAPMHSGEPNRDENALILRFTFGYHETQLDDRQLLLGAVYTSVERLPPPELRQARVSGSHFFGYPPVPFLMDGDETAIKTSILQATQKCVGKFADWFAYMPSEMPENGKARH